MKLNTGAKIIVPVGTKVSQVNETDINSSIFTELTADTFQSAKIVFPRRPPFLPDYLVVKVDGYSDAGGPIFFQMIQKRKIMSAFNPSSDIKKRIQKSITISLERDCLCHDSVQGDRCYPFAHNCRAKRNVSCPWGFPCCVH